MQSMTEAGGKKVSEQGGIDFAQCTEGLLVWVPDDTLEPGITEFPGPPEKGGVSKGEFVGGCWWGGEWGRGGEGGGGGDGEGGVGGGGGGGEGVVGAVGTGGVPTSGKGGVADVPRPQTWKFIPTTWAIGLAAGGYFVCGRRARENSG